MLLYDLQIIGSFSDVDILCLSLVSDSHSMKKLPVATPS